MSLWEYKHITSGPHGFATPALLESYLNQLGKDEWEIISYQTSPTNPLAFNGVARRTTLRDWTLESAAAAAAKAEADKLRAEFAAKFQGVTPAAEPADKPATIVEEIAAGDDGLRRLRDTERDGDPDANDEGEWDEWDNYDDDLPTLFEAIKPHLRKNQRGPGQSVGVLFLAKRWEQTEADIVGALKECGFAIPEREEDPPEYLEFEGDLYWLNLNNRHELFLNTREKPRPVFRVAQAKKLDPADPASGVLAEEAAAEQAEKARREAERLAREAEQAARRAEHEARRAAAQAAREAAQAAAKAEPAASPADGAPASEASAQSETQPAARPEIPAGPLPQGEDLLAAIRPQMRRNRRGPGYSGSTVYLARAFKHTEADLIAALAGVGLHIPEAPGEKPVKTTIGGYVYWLNKDGRGGIWINGDEVRPPKSVADAFAQATPMPASGEEPSSAAVAESTPADAVPASESPSQPSAPIVPASDTTVVADAAQTPQTDAPFPPASDAASDEAGETVPEETADANEPKTKPAKTGARKTGGTRPRAKKAPKAE